MLSPLMNGVPRPTPDCCEVQLILSKFRKRYWKCSVDVLGDHLWFVASLFLQSFPGHVASD